MGVVVVAAAVVALFVANTAQANQSQPNFISEPDPRLPLPPLPAACCAFVEKKFFSELSRKKRKHKSGEWTIERGQSRIRRRSRERGWGKGEGSAVPLLLLSFSASVL